MNGNRMKTGAQLRLENFMTAAGSRRRLEAFNDDLKREAKSLREIFRLDPSLEDGFRAWVESKRRELSSEQ